MNNADILAYFGLWSIIMTLLWVALAISLWVRRSGYVEPDDLRETSHKAHSRIDDLHARCIMVEERLSGVPTHADLNKVVEAVARIGGDVRNMQGQIGGITSAMLRMERSLDTLIDHHIKENGK